MANIYPHLTRALLCTISLLLATFCQADADLRRERVIFKPGSASSHLEGRIKGYQTVDYLISAQAGQMLNASLASQHSATYFNLLAPGETAVAFFNGSMADNQYEGQLPVSGDYTLRVYMMRAAARRNESAHYRVEVILGNPPQAPKTPTVVKSLDAKVAGTPYHATGTIACSTAPSQPLSQCPFGVTRAGLGSGRVDITLPTGQMRSLRFEQGTTTGLLNSPAQQAVFSAQKKDDTYQINIGDERYEIPEAVIMGG